MQSKQVPPWGTVYRQDWCKDDHENMVIYDQPPRGGATITLQGPAIKSFKDAEEAFYRRTTGLGRWRPGLPPKFERKNGDLFRPIYLTGSIRSCNQQKLLYASDQKRFADPDKTLHTQGLAIDVHMDWLNRFPMIRTFLKARGWVQSRPSDEPWHFSFGFLA